MDVEQNERKLFGRTRRANAAGGRERRVSVYVTPAEDELLASRAAAQGVTVPRLLFESALNMNVTTSTERKAAIAELFAVSRLAGNVANNMNQLARFANSEGTFPAEASAAAEHYRELAGKIDSAIERLASS